LTIISYAKTVRISNTDISIKLLYKPLKYDLDVVNAHSGTLSLIAAFLYSSLKKKPLVFSHHGDPVENYGSLLRRLCMLLWCRAVFKKILNCTDLIIALSEQIVESSRFLKDFSQKAIVIPNGIDPTYANIRLTKDEARRMIGVPINAKIILFVGSLTKLKGYHILLEAMKDVVTKVPDAIAIFVGPYMERREATNWQKSMDHYVIFRGPLPHKELRLYYKAADVFVLPSFSEGFPNTLLEAASFGLPLIVSDLEQLKAIVIDGFNGLIAKKGDPKSFAEKIIRVLCNDELKNTMGNNSRNFSKRYTWENIANEYEKLFIQLLTNSVRK
jgi:glycosyltransferase involved in cell wall biosynthesis